MALPKIDVPIYDVKLISSKQKIKFRPFLVKEQKLFLMNNESNDTEATVNVIRQVLKNCVLTEIDIDSLPVFDLEYLFMNLRARSVSEVVELKYRCNNTIKDEENNEKQCNMINDVSFNVLEIKPTISPEHDKKIALSEKMGIVMKYPTFEMIQKNQGKPENEMIMDLIYSTIDYVWDADKLYYTKDQTKEEIEEFIDNMQQKDLEKIQKFFATMPKLKKDIHYKCSKCGYEEDITIEGIQSFFG
jgi:rubrerythrin